MARPASALLRLLYARATPLRAVNGKLASTRSKTGDPACSAAVSEWKRKGQTKGSPVAKKLAECRAKARAGNKAAAQRNAGNELRAQAIEHRITSGKPLTAKDRLKRARELAQQRKNRTTTLSTPKTETIANAPAPAEREPWQMTAEEYEKLPQGPHYGDVVMTPEGKIGVMRGWGGMGSGRVGVQDDSGHRIWESRENLKLLQSTQPNRHAESADEWLADVSERVGALQREHQGLLLKKRLTDRLRKSLERGEISQAVYDKALQNGSALNDAEYEKAQGVERQIEDARNTPLKIKRNDVHHAHVATALRHGKPVPPHVLSEYPDLAREAAQRSTPAPAPATPDRPARNTPERAARAKELTAQRMEDRRARLASATAAPAPTPAPEVAPAPAEPGPYTLAHHAEIQKRVAAGTITADELRNHFENLVKHEGAIKAELGAKTLKQLAPNGTGGLKKAEVIDRILHTMQQRYVVGDSFSWDPFREKPVDAIRRKLASTTDEHIQDAAAKRSATREKFSKALTNPETADEFRQFAEIKGEAALSPEQRARWDDLRATERRSQEAARAAQVAPTQRAPEGLSVTLHETTHTKKGTPLHVAVLNQRTDRDVYDDLNRKAKQLGGYYSSFRGAGAIPGFQFPSKESAEKFRDLVHGRAVDRSEDLAAHREARQSSAAERLHTIAEGMHERAAEQLSRDRLTNTARRAGMAASAEAQARAVQAQARTLHAIAEGMDAGTLKHLGGVRNPADLHTLDRVLRDARWKRYRQLQQEHPHSHHDWEQFMQAPHSEEDVLAAEYPHPRMWSDHLQSAAREFADEPGLKRIAQRLARTATAQPKFAGQGNGFKFSGGSLHDPKAFDWFPAHAAPEGKAVRVHQSYDWRLAQQGQGHGPFYSADKGRSFGTSPEIAIQAALRRGHGLDLTDAPKDELLSIDNPHDIAALHQAAKRLKSHPDRSKRHVGETFAGQVEHYNRLRRADIKSPAELRAALREYLPLKSRREAEDPVKAKERALVGRKIEGFFPTPPAVVDRLLDAADIQPGHSVLEPSAGKGDLADAVRERHPETTVETIEPHSELRGILEAKGHTLAGHDFLEHTGTHDRIVMNPPFERGQDMAHVRHAYERLAPGGKLAAVMSEGPFNRTDRASTEFRNWLESVGGESEPLPEGSFAGRDAFRQTGVNTRLVTISRPHGKSNGAARASDSTAQRLAYHRRTMRHAPRLRRPAAASA